MKKTMNQYKSRVGVQAHDKKEKSQDYDLLQDAGVTANGRKGDSNGSGGGSIGRAEESQGEDYYYYAEILAEADGCRAHLNREKSELVQRFRAAAELKSSRAGGSDNEEEY